jgi:tetratricopeptide (TPR) repeat protein
MKILFSSTLWTWPAMALALTCLAAPAADAQESSEASKVEVPATQNPYLQAVATLYEQAKHEEALSKLEKALEWKSNGPQEVQFLKLMKGVLQAELGQSGALESFKEALAQDPQAQLPVPAASWRLRKLFEQARSTAGLPADEELLAEEIDPGAEPSGPPPRRYGLSVGVRGEVDVLGLSTTTAVAPAVSVGYTWEQRGGTLTLLTQSSPGLRAEGQFHPFILGWVRPYAKAGTTAFFREKNAQGGYTFLGGISGRAALGVDVQWNSRMYAFVDVAYDRFFIGGERYKSQSLLFSIGVGLFP